MRRVQPREPVYLPSARDNNSLVDVIDRVEATSANVAALTKSPALRVKNTTADKLAPLSVLMIDGPLIEPVPGRADSMWTRFPGFRGIVPEQRPQLSAIVVTTKTLKPNEVGPCVLGATFWTRIRIDDEAHQYATWIAGQTRRLRSDRVGPARIVWRERTPYPLPESQFAQQPTVLSYVDNTQPPPDETIGARYILDDTGTTHANWDGAAALSIVEFDGVNWVETVPTDGMFCVVTGLAREYRFESGQWISQPIGSMPEYLGPWCLIHLCDLQQQLAPSQSRFGYVDGSITAGEVADRDADGDALTYDTDDPDTQVDDDMTPGRGSVRLWDYQISRRSDRRFPIVGFLDTGEVDGSGDPIYDYTQPIVTDPNGVLQYLSDSTDDRLYVDHSTRSNGYYYLAGDAVHSSGQTRLPLTEALSPLPDPNPDAEVLGDLVTEAWAPVWKRDETGELVLADQEVFRVDEAGDPIPNATAELPVREEPVIVWNLWEQTSATTATPVEVVREHDRWRVRHGGCTVSDLDMTPDVDL